MGTILLIIAVVLFSITSPTYMIGANNQVGDNDNL